LRGQGRGRQGDAVGRLPDDRDRRRGRGPLMMMPVLALQVAADQVVAAAPQITTPHGGAGQAVFFWLFALLAAGGSILTITRRNAVSAVMFLVGTFLGVAALYALLYAHFLAVIQILVYAGAIMVLFVFVVMILNKEEEEPWALRGILGKVLAG